MACALRAGWIFLRGAEGFARGAGKVYIRHVFGGGTAVSLKLTINCITNRTVSMVKGTCIITGEEVNISMDHTFDHYDVTILNRTVSIFFCHNCRSKFPKVSHHIFKSLIVNKIWPERTLLVSKDCTHQDGSSITDAEIVVLENYLSSISYPKTPTERLDSFFMFLFHKQNFHGEAIPIDPRKEEVWMRNYFVNEAECFFYLQGLEEQKLIKIDRPNSAYEVRITHKGLNHAIEIEKVGIQSNTCFVAMAFDERTNIYREAIKSAVVRTRRFQPILIDEQDVESDKTIPDAIFLEIKRSKFCIADFTYHRNGVYFECGYALGLGKPVIYTCEKQEFEKAHFDVKQLQHIIYSDPDELERKLYDKIEAWIKSS